MTTVINAVMVDCRTEVEEKYNEWYNEVHIPMCLKYDGMLRATRYRLIRGPLGHARYLTVYEFKDKIAMDAFPNSPECAAATQEMQQTWRENDFQIRLAAQYETLGVFGARRPQPGRFAKPFERCLVFVIPAADSVRVSDRFRLSLLPVQHLIHHPAEL